MHNGMNMLKATFSAFICQKPDYIVSDLVFKLSFCTILKKKGILTWSTMHIGSFWQSMKDSKPKTYSTMCVTEML